MASFHLKSRRSTTTTNTTPGDLNLFNLLVTLALVGKLVVASNLCYEIVLKKLADYSGLQMVAASSLTGYGTELL